MEMKNVFDTKDTKGIISRINKLSPDTKQLWGTMSVAKMLAHCNVTYEFIYDTKHAKPNFLKKFILKLLVKPTVIGDKPYKQNGQTAPEFIIKDDKNFEVEKKRLIDHINKTQQLGATHFHNKESHSFGPLTTKEWNTMFYKHLDHHLRQFGA